MGCEAPTNPGRWVETPRTGLIGWLFGPKREWVDYTRDEIEATRPEPPPPPPPAKRCRHCERKTP